MGEVKGGAEVVTRINYFLCNSELSPMKDIVFLLFRSLCIKFRILHLVNKGRIAVGYPITSAGVLLRATTITAYE